MNFPHEKLRSAAVADAGARALHSISFDALIARTAGRQYVQRQRGFVVLGKGKDKACLDSRIAWFAARPPFRFRALDGMAPVGRFLPDAEPEGATPSLKMALAAKQRNRAVNRTASALFKDVCDKNISQASEACSASDSAKSPPHRGCASRQENCTEGFE